MKFLLLFMTILFSIQTPTEKWYFAWQDHSIVAFTASGETRTLPTPDAEYAKGFRLTPSSALIGLYTGFDVQALAYITPDGLTTLEGNVDLKTLGSQGYTLLAYEHPYVVIRPDECRFQWCRYGRPVWLANVDAGTLEVIADNVFVDSPQALALSGHFLCYARREKPDATIWTLWERDLQTGEERNFYRFVSPIADFDWPISLAANSTGEYWLHNEPTVIAAGEHPEFWRRLIRNNGDIEVLDHVPEGEIPQYTWTLAGDWLLRQSVECKRACQLEARPASGGDWQTFAISDNGYFDFFRLLNDGRALARQFDGTTWILRESGSPLRLGVFGFLDWKTPDHILLLTTWDEQTPTPYRVWDVPNERVLLEGVVQQGIRADFYEGGILIYQFSLGEGRFILTAARQQDEDPPPVLVYRTIDGKTFEPADSNYFDILPDGLLLESRHEDGIYRVDPESGAETLLVPDAEVVKLR